MNLKNDLYINVEPYTEILGGLSFVLSISNGVVKLTGKTGTGKTAMCIELLRELKTEKIEFVHFPNAPENYAVVQKAIQDKLKLSPKTAGDKESFIQALTAHIIKKSFDEQKLVLIFDDVENLSAELLAELTSFRHIHLNDQGLVSIVLSGTDVMDKQLSASASSLVSDLLVSYTLEPMNREQLAEFCSAYLAEIKMDARLSEDNISQLLELTEGLPGDIPEMIPEILDSNDSKVYVRKKKQKEFVTKTTKTLTHEFVDPFTDEETKRQVFGRWKWPVGPTVLVASSIVALFVGYAAYVFIPDDIIPATVSYFNNDDELEAEAALIDAALVVDAEVIVDQVTDNEISETETLEPSPAPAEETAAIEVTPEQPVQESLAIESETSVELEVSESVAEREALEAEEAEDEIVVAEIAVADNIESELAAEIIAPADPAPVQTAPAQVAATDDVQRVVEEWLQAWQRQDLDGYFSSYHESFEPNSFASLATWQNQRERSILRPASIRISYDEYMVLSRNEDSTMLTLRMNYDSPTYADRTLKQLGLIKDAQGQWRIIFEENIQVERLPVNRLAGEQAVDRLPVYLVPPTDTASATIVSVPPAQRPANLSVNQEQFYIFVNDWLSAWQAQDVNTYFNHYQDNYRGYEYPSPLAWEQDRITKISRPTYIELRISDFEVLQETTNDAVVQFSLEYRSAYYADRTLKEVLLTRDANGELQISNELNRQVQTLPIYRRINNALTALF